MNYSDIPTLKKECAKYYYVFIGQNATTGQPHPITGMLSNYGHIISFKHKADALQYVNNFYSNNLSEFAVAGTAMSLRRFKRGMSVVNYLQDLLMNDALTYDENGL
jgi:hypothetical protein